MLTTEKPEKPKHYTRDNFLIVLLTTVVFIALWAMDTRNPFLFLVTFWFYILTNHFWFRRYHAQIQQYQAQQRSSEQQSKTGKASQVNENITKYRHRLLQKRAEARWWQFWI